MRVPLSSHRAKVAATAVRSDRDTPASRRPRSRVGTHAATWATGASSSWPASSTLTKASRPVAGRRASPGGVPTRCFFAGGSAAIMTSCGNNVTARAVDGWT